MSVAVKEMEGADTLANAVKMILARKARNVVDEKVMDLRW
jgi:hypothetical protein